MLKDLGNQKLPRFKAGAPLLEQVTAERMNDICSMIEACRLQNGVGYTMNRSVGGTTLTILDMASASKVKLWNINFDDDISLSALEISADVLEHLEDIVADVLPDTEEYQGNIQAYLNQVIGTHKSGKAGTADGLSERIKELFEPYKEQIEDAIREYLESIDPAFVVRSNIQSYFSSHDQSPHSGDMIWNAKYGLCYAIFKEVKNSDDTSFPEENGLYSILFTVFDVRYFALYLGPVENPEKFLETLTGFVGKTIGDVIGNLTEGNASAYLNATAAALKALWDDIPEPIPDPMGPQGPQGIQGPKGDKGDSGDVSAISASLASLESRMANAEGRISANENAILNMRQDIDYVKRTIDSAVNVALVDANGNIANVKVLQHAKGNELMTEIYYFDPVSNMMTATKVFSNASNAVVTGWKPTEIQFVLPNGESASITILADSSTLQALGTVFQSEGAKYAKGVQP